MQLVKEKTKKKYLLWLIIILNIFSLGCSLYFNNYLSGGNKMADSPLNFFWEWLTVFWCVWYSILTCVYSFIELKNISLPSGSQVSKRQKIFGFSVAIGNLFSILIFLFALPKYGINKGFFWWVYSTVWHFMALPLNVFYFFRFVKIKEKLIYKKKFLTLLFSQPALFLAANLFRRFLVAREYRKKPYKKFMIPPFAWITKGKIWVFVLFAITALFLFWLVSWLLLKIKRKFFSSQNYQYQQGIFRIKRNINFKREREREREREQKDFLNQ